MRNYFNTPSSFGFTTQSSYNGDLISARSNQSDINVLHSISNHEYSAEDYVDQQGRLQSRNMMIKQIIIADKNKQAWPSGIRNINQPSDETNITKNTKVSKVFKIFDNLYGIKERQSKCSGLKKLQKNMRNQRLRELKMYEILSRNIIRRLYSGLGQIFEIWKFQQRSYSTRQSYVISKKLSCKVLKSVINKKLISIFCILKYSPAKAVQVSKTQVKKIISFSASNIDVPSISISTVSRNISINSKICQPGSYSVPYMHQQNAKKMTKMPIKAAQYQASNKNMSFAGLNLSQTIENIVRKSYHQFYLQLKAVTQIKNMESKKQQNLPEQEQSMDSNEIILNILKHTCWLASQEQSKRKLKNQNNKDEKWMQERSKKMKEIIRLINRKEDERRREAIESWREQIIEQRLQIMKDVKRLQATKESFIQNYK